MLPTEQGKVTIQLKYGGKCVNRFNAKIISNNNGKRMKIFASYFAQSYSKKTPTKTTENCHFRYNNIELICKEYLTAI